MIASGTVYGELQIELNRTPAGIYDVSLELCDPSNDAEVPVEHATAALSLEALRAAQANKDQYAKLLTSQVFQPTVLAFFSKAKAAFDASGRQFRLRLLIGASAPELHAVRWELLLDPENGLPLATSQRILLSRFMLSDDWRLIKLRPKADLRALIAVAAPTDLTQYDLPAVDRDGEVSRAQSGLGGIACDVLGPKEPVLLSSLVDAMNKGVDIVYLVCHGVFSDDAQPEPAILLEDTNRNTMRVTASELARQVSQLPQVPRLVVLASCESAGKGLGSSADVLAALAPRLAAAGVPAILAMQSEITMETVKQMMPVFFRELLVDGQIDRAVAAARNAVLSRPDHWVPALFVRLRGGRIWYVPGFTGEQAAFEQWQSICGFIRSGDFVPILGPDLTEHLYGTTRALALELAAANGYPFSPNDESDPAKVAQYISTKSSLASVQQLFRQAFRSKFEARAGLLLKQPAGSAIDPAQLVTAILGNPDDPLTILNSLDAKLYITASGDGLFGMCLQKNKTPKEIVIQWRDERRSEIPVYPDGSAKSPLLYYVFGKSSQPETWVLTEDDFFDFLIRASQYNLMPLPVSHALTSGSLFFLGFPLDDWKFRVLFRMIMAKGGSSALASFNHVAVQVNPEENTLADANRAKRYLEGYFKASKIDIFWGTSADFLLALRNQLSKYPTAAPVPVAAAVSPW